MEPFFKIRPNQVFIFGFYVGNWNKSLAMQFCYYPLLVISLFLLDQRIVHIFNNPTIIYIFAKFFDVNFIYIWEYGLIRCRVYF